MDSIWKRPNMHWSFHNKQLTGVEFDLFVVINNVNQWVLTDQSLFVNLIAPQINQLFQNKQTDSGLL